jgi:hypothetical protein
LWLLLKLAPGHTVVLIDHRLTSANNFSLGVIILVACVSAHYSVKALIAAVSAASAFSPVVLITTI